MMPQCSNKPAIYTVGWSAGPLETLDFEDTSREG